MSTIRKVFAEDVPRISGLAHATIQGEVVYTAGQISFQRNQEGNLELLYPNDPSAQTMQTIRLLEKVLHAAGSQLANVLKATIYYTRAEDYLNVSTAYRKFFEAAGVENPEMARSAVQVAGLALPGALVEIEFIATLNG